MSRDQWQLIEQRTGSATTAAKRFVWSAHYLDALAVQQHDTDANGSLDRTLYATHDANFNVTAAVSTAGVAQQRFLYDAYGARSVLAFDWQPTTNAPILDHGHQGGRSDAATGFILFRHRYLSPGLMRWTSRDPAGYVDGGSLYEALRSNPALFLDSGGLATRGRVAFDADGLHGNQAGESVSVSLEAFIPKRLGSPPGSPAIWQQTEAAHWLELPTGRSPDSSAKYHGVSGAWQSWWASTDNRDHARQRGTYRLRIAVEGFGEGDIGNLRRLGASRVASDDVGLSHLGRFVGVVGYSGVTAIHPAGGAIQSRQASPRTSVTVWDSPNGCASSVTVVAAAAFPFRPGIMRLGPVPGIDMSLTVDLAKGGDGGVRIKVTGSHNAFPAYALYDSSSGVRYEHQPTSRGPGLLNLGVLGRSFGPVEWEQ